jgi:lipopolysaccharide export system protein LptA
LLQQPVRTARGDKLVYTSADQKFVLSGAPARLPQVEDAQHGITRGDQLVFYRNDNRVLVESAGSDRTLTETRVKPK